MRALLLGLGLAAVLFFTTQLHGVAWAGEKAIGRLQITDAGSVTNLTTPAPFTLLNNQAVSIQCPDAGAWLSVEGLATCGADFPCWYMGPTGFVTDTIEPRVDGGTGGVVTMKCPAGVSSCWCGVFGLKGNEP